MRLAGAGARGHPPTRPAPVTACSPGAGMSSYLLHNLLPIRGWWTRSAPSRSCSATTRTSWPRGSRTSSNLHGRASPCRPPAPRRWWPCTWRVPEPARRRVRHGAGRRRHLRVPAASAATCYERGRHPLRRRPLPRLRRRRRAARSAAAASAWSCSSGCSDALADGDTIHAVIRGSAINNDGARKVGYTAPSVDGQADGDRARRSPSRASRRHDRLRRGPRHRHAARRPDRGRAR